MDLNQFSTVDIVLDKANDNIIQRQTISAGDRDGRSLTLQVTNEGSIGEVPGLTANLLWTNHSSNLSDLSAFSVVDRATSVFKINYPQNMLTAGKVTAQIQLLHNGKVTHSKKFEIIVLDIAGKLKGVLQSAEYTALVEALAKTNGFEGDIRNLDLKKADAQSLAAANYDISELRNKKVDKNGNEQVTLSMLAQEVKEAITGGSVSVVGPDAVNTSNIVNEAVTSDKIDGVLSKEIENGGTALRAIYKYLFKEYNTAFVAPSEGLATIYQAKNLSQNEKSIIILNQQEYLLLPKDEIVASTLKTPYQKMTISSIINNTAQIASLGAEIARYQIKLIGGVKNPENYTVISNNAKYGNEKQVNFADRTTPYLGYHTGEFLEVGVSKVDVLAGGFTYDLTGIKNYLKTQNIEFWLETPTKIDKEIFGVVCDAGQSVSLTGDQNAEVSLGFFVKENWRLKGNKYYKKYQALLKNQTTVDYQNKQAYIKISFDHGVCRSPENIVVTDENDNTIDFQWENETFVNRTLDVDAGTYIDGYLKDGKIWVITDLQAGKSKIFNVYVYQNVVTNFQEKIIENRTPGTVTLNTGNVLATFNQSSKFLLDSLKVGAQTIPLVQDPTINIDATTAYIRATSDYVFKAYETTKIGTIFKDMIVTIENTDLQLKIKTRLFLNGIVESTMTFKALKNLVAGSVNGMQQRINVSAGQAETLSERAGFFRKSYKDGTLHKSLLLKYAHGDTPRTTDYPDLPNYPVLAAVLENNPSAGWYKLVGGWQYASNGTTYPIKKGEVFESQIEINLVGANDAENETVRAFNLLNTRATADNKYKIKREISQLIKDYAENIINDYDDRHDASLVNYYFPSFAGKMLRYKLFNELALVDVFNQYNDYMILIFGIDDTEKMWTKYKQRTFPIHLAGRAYAVAKVLHDEFIKLNDVDNANACKKMLSDYADLIARSVTETGFLGLYYNDGYNSNGTTSGILGLSVALSISQKNEWEAALDALKIKLTDFVPVENYLTDGPKTSLSVNHYAHYVLYSLFNISASNQNLLNTSAYSNLTLSAYGAPKEQEFCIASSRRGASSTNTYAVYLLLKEDTYSSVAEAKRTLLRLIEQELPSGGHEHPLEKWVFNPEQTYDGAVAIELQVLMNIVFDFGLY